MIFQAIRDRLSKATPGPWERHSGERIGFLGRCFSYITSVSTDEDGDRKVIAPERIELENADLIAHSPTDIKILLEALDLAIETLEGIKRSALEGDDTFSELYCYCESEIVLAKISELDV